MEVLEELGIKPVNVGACNEQWQSETKTNLISSINPANEEAIADVYAASAEDYEKLINDAETAFSQWQQVPVPKRGEIIRLIADAVREKKDLLGTLVSLEVGKIKSEGDGEVQEVIDIADFAAGLSRTLYGKIIPSERAQHTMLEQWHPLGPIGVITAFNFPVAVWAWNAMIAAVCGNTVLWRPSPKAPLCALAMQHICNIVMRRCGYHGVFSLMITEDIKLTKQMIEDSRLPLISFTGSTAVGKQVAAAVSQRLGKSILELSGNNAVIVTESADLNKAAPSIVFGAVGAAGQRCTTTRRVIVHESCYQELAAMLKSAYRNIKWGNPLGKNVLLGPLIDREAVNTFQQTITELKEIGADILHGGGVIEDKGFFVEPTLVKAKNNWDVVQRETFAPILYIMTYRELDEAVALHNSVKQGLSSAIFTEDLKTAQTFIAAIGSDCGIANINIGTSGAEIGGAFGGEKETGGGREAGSDAWRAYMRRQTSTINWSNELPLAQGVKFNIFT